MRLVWLVATSIAVTLVVVAGSDVLPTKLIYNASESAPTGFYWIDREPVKRGDFALVRVPKHVEKLVAKRAYLSPHVPLLKRVSAIGGDEICRSGTDIFVSGTIVATALEQDQSRQEMPSWQGCRTLEQSEIFLLQDHPYSFDGRYFGPVKRELVIGKAQYLQFLRWKNGED